MNYIGQITCVILLASPFLLYGSQNKDFDYEFIKHDTSYSFRGSFVIRSEAGCLIDIIFDYACIAEYAPAAHSIELIQQGENWYDVAYSYRKYLVLENTSVWRRILNQDKQKIIFKLQSSINNLNILPDMTSSAGYYHIQKEKQFSRVEYYQECTLSPGLFINSYIDEAKKEAIDFLHEFKKYLEKKCNYMDVTISK